MSSISDELLANERVQILALIEAARYMEHDKELIDALLGVKWYLHGLIYSNTFFQDVKEGSNLESLIKERINPNKCEGCKHELKSKYSDTCYYCERNTTIKVDDHYEAVSE